MSRRRRDGDTETPREGHLRTQWRPVGCRKQLQETLMFLADCNNKSKVHTSSVPGVSRTSAGADGSAPNRPCSHIKKTRKVQNVKRADGMYRFGRIHGSILGLCRAQTMARATHHVLWIQGMEFREVQWPRRRRGLCAIKQRDVQGDRLHVDGKCQARNKIVPKTRGPADERTRHVGQYDQTVASKTKGIKPDHYEPKHPYKRNSSEKVGRRKRSKRRDVRGQRTERKEKKEHTRFLRAQGRGGLPRKTPACKQP